MNMIHLLRVTRNDFLFRLATGTDTMNLACIAFVWPLASGLSVQRRKREKIRLRGSLNASAYLHQLMHMDHDSRFTIHGWLFDFQGQDHSHGLQCAVCSVHPPGQISCSGPWILIGEKLRFSPGNKPSLSSVP